MSKRRPPLRSEPQPEPEPQPEFVYKPRANAGFDKARELFTKFDILFLIGPAGTGKTHTAVSLAMHAANVVITRPAVEVAGEELGFLPGDVNEKMLPYMLPIMDVLRTQLGKARARKAFKRFEVCPIAYIRGRTLSDCVAILDEAQNATRSQRKTYIQRLGLGGKLIISGDPSQCDIRCGGKVFEREVAELEKAGIAGVVRFDQTMQMRNPILEQVEAVYAKLG